MSARLLASSASRVTMRGVLPLTRTHANIRAVSYSTNMSRETNACIIGQYSVGSRRSPTTGARLLSSSSASLFDKKDAAAKDGSPSQSRPGSHKNSVPVEDDFKISFRDLGMNRVTKFVVYAVIGILGTMETIFWCKALWRWWTGGEEENEGME